MFTELKRLRKLAKLTQAQMASRFGLSKTAYCELESGKSEWSERHTMLLEHVSLSLACDQGDLNLCLPNMRRAVVTYAALLYGAEGAATLRAPAS